MEWNWMKRYILPSTLCPTLFAFTCEIRRVDCATVSNTNPTVSSTIDLRQKHVPIWIGRCFCLFVYLYACVLNNMHTWAPGLHHISTLTHRAHSFVRSSVRPSAHSLFLQTKAMRHLQYHYRHSSFALSYHRDACGLLPNEEENRKPIAVCSVALRALCSISKWLRERENKSSTESLCICSSSLLYLLACLPACLTAYMAVAVCFILCTQFTLYYCFLFSAPFRSIPYIRSFVCSFIRTRCVYMSTQARVRARDRAFLILCIEWGSKQASRQV